MEIEHNVRRGMSPADARRAAVAAFGGVQRFREETRDTRGFVLLDSLMRDTRFALRRLRRVPLYTAGSVLTLAIGLGAATGIGTLAYSILLRSLPYPDADRLVRISISTPGLGITSTENSSGTMAFVRERSRSFSAVGSYLENEGVIITDGDTPERVTGAIVTPSLFSMLGVRPAAGRLLRKEDDTDDLLTPVMLSYDLWQRRYGGDPRIVGGYIELQRNKRLVVGVLPEGFDFPSRDAAIYYPDGGVVPAAATLNMRYLTVIAKLRDGVTVDRAQAELDALFPHLPERFPELTVEALQRSGLKPGVQTLRDAIVAPVRGELTLLAIMVAVVLVIAIANVATLALLRAGRLRGEIAVSRALGASLSRIGQRFIVEGVVVAGLSAALAIPIALAGVAGASRFLVGQLPSIDQVELGPVAVILLVAVAVLIGALLGVIAAMRTAGSRMASLRADSRATGSTAWRRAQQSLVTLQIALALSLLLAAGLLGRSLLRLSRVDIGLSARDGVTFATTIPRRAYPRYQEAAAFHLRVVEELQRIPGVTGAAAASDFPLMPQLLSVHPRIEAPGMPGSPQVIGDANMVTPNYFSVMGIPLRAGRTFATGDGAAATPGVVLSASLAREIFGSADPLGRELRLISGSTYPPFRIVGVAGDVYADRIADGPLRQIYFPLIGDFPASSTDTVRLFLVPAGVHYVVRSELPSATLAPSIRRALASVDPRVPMWGLRSIESLTSAATARVRFTMLLLIVASIATLLLGAIGLYSVIAYAVAGRGQEFAIRIALGATPGGVVGLVFREGVIVAIVGIISGLALFAASSRVIRGLLYQVSAGDVLTYVASVAIVSLVVAAATWIPARRAAKSDPASALRTA